MSAIHQLSTFKRGCIALKTYLSAPFGSKWLTPLPFDTPERRQHGLIIVLPGIEGPSSINHSLVHGLIDAELPYAVRLHDWTLRIKPALVNLWLTYRTRQAAAHVVEMIVDYQDRHPGSPVQLIGHSGGAALVPYILEELPEGRQIENGVMIAPALSPVFPLKQALNNVVGKIYNVRSRGDWYFLGVGTSLVGTLDRRFGFSAGNVGFRCPSPEDAEEHQLYQKKFSEIRYRWEMLKSWHYGGHLSCVNRMFISEHISPLMRADQAILPRKKENFLALPQEFCSARSA